MRAAVLGAGIAFLIAAFAGPSFGRALARSSSAATALKPLSVVSVSSDIASPKCPSFSSSFCTPPSERVSRHSR